MALYSNSNFIMGANTVNPDQYLVFILIAIYRLPDYISRRESRREQA